MATRDPAPGAEDEEDLTGAIAQTGPGIPDDAASPGYDPEADAEAEREMEADPPSIKEVFGRT